MKIIKGDIWKFHEEGAYIGIPTNGIIKNNGNLVMGRGLALQASEHFPELPVSFGKHVKTNGNTVCILENLRIFSFPTKNNWVESSDLFLIEQSAQTLSDYFAGDMFEFGLKIPEIYLPKVGCGLGELNWKQVEPILHAYLNDIVTIIDWR
jgi:hypothetical protein